MHGVRAKRLWLALRFAVTCLKWSLAAQAQTEYTWPCLWALDWGSDPKLRQERILRETGWVPSAMAWHRNSLQLCIP